MDKAHKEQRYLKIIRILKEEINELNAKLKCKEKANTKLQEKLTSEKNRETKQKTYAAAAAEKICKGKKISENINQRYVKCVYNKPVDTKAHTKMNTLKWPTKYPTR